MSWSRALARELKAEGSGVEVLGALCMTVTNVGFRKVPPTFTQPDTSVFAEATVGRVGCGEYVVWGCLVHGVMNFVVGLLPE
jgi:hypothetical protein